MKSKKKVIECAVVLAFTLVIAGEAIPGNAVTNKTEQYTREKNISEMYLLEEAFTNDTGKEVASKAKTLIDVVAEPENTLETEEKAKEPENVPEETKGAEAAEVPKEDGKEKEPEAEAETEETEAEAETEETEAEAETEESKAEAEIEEPKAEAETEEPKAEAETEEPKAEAETEDPEAEAETEDAETDIEAEESKTEESKTEEMEKESQEEILAGQEESGEEIQEVSEWESRLMPEVEEYLNIRAEGNEEAELVGKLYKGAAAEIVERGEEWTKITSGNVEGYVKNDFCVFNEEAEAMAKEQGTIYATTLTEGLRVRSEASDTEDTKILDLLEEGKKMKVDKNTDAPEGWVAVVCSDQTAYVSEQYVSVELELGKAISIEEEQAAIQAAREEEERKRAAEAQSSDPEQSSGAETTQKEAVAASYDDVTLLGALIQCEAGAECYEGQLAVGAVVMNRLRSGYAGSISGVIYQSGQFTPASSGALDGVLSRGVNGSCLQAAQEAINGVDNVGGATSFRRAGSGRAGIVIGNHVFF